MGWTRLEGRRIKKSELVRDLNVVSWPPRWYLKLQRYNEISPHTGQNGHHKKKNLQTTNAGEEVEKREQHSCIVGGNVNWYSHYGRSTEIP